MTGRGHIAAFLACPPHKAFMSSSQLAALCASLLHSLGHRGDFGRKKMISDLNHFAALINLF